MVEVAAATSRPAQPSLRRRLLAFVLIPVGLLLPDAMLTYGVALAYSNHVHHRDLGDDALTLAQMPRGGRLDGSLSPQARFLLAYDPDEGNYFSVRSRLHGVLADNAQFRQIAASPVDQAPVLYDAPLDSHTLRVATVNIRPPIRTTRGR